MSTAHVPHIRCVSLTSAPEWTVEQVPMLASGHEDGTVRWWRLREPASSIAPGMPRACSATPVAGWLQPAWEIAEQKEARIDLPDKSDAISSLVASDALWAGTMQGRVLKWQTLDAPL